MGLEVLLLLFLAYWGFHGLIIVCFVLKSGFPWGFKWLSRTVRLALFLACILLFTNMFVGHVFFPLTNSVIRGSHPLHIIFLIWMSLLFILSYLIRQSALAMRSYSSASIGLSEKTILSKKANANAFYFSLVSISSLLSLCFLQVLLSSIVPRLLKSNINDMMFNKFLIILIFLCISSLISLSIYRLRLLRIWRDHPRLARLRVFIASIIPHQIIDKTQVRPGSDNIEPMSRFDKLLSTYGMLSVLTNLFFISLFTLLLYDFYARIFSKDSFFSATTFIATSYFYSINISTFFLYGYDNGHAWLFEKEQNMQRKSSNINIGSHWSQRLARSMSEKFKLVRTLGDSRVPENILHWHSAIGGTIGAYAGHWFFNHKKMFTVFQDKSNITSNSIIKFAPVYERIIFSQVMLFVILTVLVMHTTRVS